MGVLAVRLVNMKISLSGDAGSTPLDDPYAARTSHHGGMCEPDEQAMLDHAHDAVEPIREQSRIGDPLERGIQNPVPAVRDESVAIPTPPQQRGSATARGHDRGLDVPPRRREPERYYLDRQRETSERGYPFRFVGDDDHPRRGGGDDLFPQQRTAAALDQAQVGGDLVRPVDGEIQLRHLVQAGERHAEALGIGARRLRRGYRDHVEAGADALRQQLDEMLGGRAAAETEPHARSHEFEGTGSGGTFLGVHIHCDREAPRKIPAYGGVTARLSNAVRRESISPLPPSSRASPAAGEARAARPAAACHRARQPVGDPAGWSLPPSFSILMARWSTAR